MVDIGSFTRIFVLTEGASSGRKLRITPAPHTTPRRHHCFMGRISSLVPMFSALLLGVLACYADESEIVQRELGRRAQVTQQAQQALLAGDKAYRLADYATAVTEFARAFDLFPGGDATAGLKSASRERFAQASVERARELAKVGDYPEAAALLDAVLEPGVAPKHAGAREMMARLGDPIRNNPALTPEHAKKVEEVQRYLSEAEGFVELGQFDRAQVVYGQVLTIDPHNSAARRGMESVHAQKVEYSDTARDAARAKLLSDVGQAWASPIPKGVSGLADADFGALRDGARFGASASEKLASMIIPVVDMDQVRLGEAIDFLRQQAAAPSPYK